MDYCNVFISCLDIQCRESIIQQFAKFFKICSNKKQTYLHLEAELIFSKVHFFGELFIQDYIVMSSAL